MWINHDRMEYPSTYVRMTPTRTFARDPEAIFPPQSSAVPDKRTIRTNHSMALHDERHLVGTFCLPNHAGFFRLSEDSCDVTIAACLARRNLFQSLPGGSLQTLCPCCTVGI